MKNTVEIPFTFILSQYPGEEIKPNNRLMAVCEPSELGDLILKINKDPIEYLCSDMERIPGMVYGHMAKSQLIQNVFSHKSDLGLLLSGKNNEYVNTLVKVPSTLIIDVDDKGFLLNQTGVIHPGEFIAALSDLPRFFKMAENILAILGQYHASIEMLLSDPIQYTIFSDSNKGYAYYAPFYIRTISPGPSILNYTSDLVLDVAFGRGDPDTFEGSFMRLTGRRLGRTNDKHTVVITDLFHRNQKISPYILTTFNECYDVKPRIDVVTTLPEETQ